MPHQCTNCGRRFPDGSKEMLTGCPDCGGKKFQFTPASRVPDEEVSANAESRPTTDTQSTLQEAVESAGGVDDTIEESTSPDRPESTSDPDSPAQEPLEPGTDAMEDDFEWVGGEEDDAQATARTDIVSPDELPSHGGDAESGPRGSTARERSTTETTATSGAPGSSVANGDRPDSGRVVSEPAASNPSIDDLRKELNQQFESIKIINPGQYELNLMELYNREEHIIALQEDGRYVINVPESWHDGP